MHSVRINKGKEKAGRQLHTWIFSVAIDRISGGIDNGEIVVVTDSGDNFLAYGLYNAQSRVAVRLLEWDAEAIIDESWWRKKIAGAVQRREHLPIKDTNAYRLIFSEADYIPGL